MAHLEFLNPDSSEAHLSTLGRRVPGRIQTTVVLGLNLCSPHGLHLPVSVSLLSPQVETPP